MKEKEFDATLVHVYAQPANKGVTKTDLRGHIQISAAAEMYKDQATKRLVIANSFALGSGGPLVSRIMFDELVRKGVNPEDIIVYSSLPGTTGEIKTFINIVKSQDWERLSSVANRAHQPRIQLIHEMENINNVKRFNAEDILRRKSKHYKHFFDRFRCSSRELLFIAREAVVTLAYKLGFEKNIPQFANQPMVQKLKSFLDK